MRTFLEFVFSLSILGSAALTAGYLPSARAAGQEPVLLLKSVAAGQVVEVHGVRGSGLYIFSPSLPRNDKVVLSVFRDVIKSEFGITVPAEAYLDNGTPASLIMGSGDKAFALIMVKDERTGQIAAARILRRSPQ